MPTRNVIIEFDGEEDAELYSDMISLEVELGGDMASMAYLTLVTQKDDEADGAWRHVDDERFGPLKPISIKVDLEGAEEDLFSGYITNTRPYFDREPGHCVFEMWAMDATALMGRHEKTKAWEDKKDSEIAQDIFAEYNLSASVGDSIEDTLIKHDKEVSTIMQRESDIQFLKRLALRNGYECYVEGDTGYFRPAQTAFDLSQPVLAAHFGEETTLINFSADIQAIGPTEVSGAQIDPLNKELVEASVSATTLDALGAEDHVDLRPSGIDVGTALVGASVSTGQAGLESMCRGLYLQADWFIDAEGVVAASRYGHVLKPYPPVTIKGVGERYSGVYYVTQVTHSFTTDGYSQRFKAKRNAVVPTGDEDFESSASDSMGLL